MKPTPIPPDRMQACRTLYLAEGEAYQRYSDFPMPALYTDKQKDPRFPEWEALQAAWIAAGERCRECGDALRNDYPWAVSINRPGNEPDLTWDWCEAVGTYANLVIHAGAPGLQKRHDAIKATQTALYEPQELEVGKHYLSSRGALLTVTRKTHGGKCVYAGAERLPKPPAKLNYWDSLVWYREISETDKELMQTATDEYRRIYNETLAEGPIASS